MHHVAIISVNFDIQEWCVRLLYSLLPLTYKNNKPCCYILFWFWHNHYNNPVNFFPKNNCTVNLFVAVLRLNYTGTSNNNIHWCFFIFLSFSVSTHVYISCLFPCFAFWSRNQYQHMVLAKLIYLLLNKRNGPIKFQETVILQIMFDWNINLTLF